MVPIALREIAGGDEELLRQLVADLASGLAKSIELMRNAEGDDQLRLFAHRLKGGALAIGSDRLAKLAAAAERDPARRADLIVEIDETFAAEFGDAVAA
ncbi:MAG: Hpt domain-containing protein [Pacificimonas sp.]|jgi:HPt (histidine-containing phosphotransfer) domain-containing protein|nr:Hpt domain-containing protein [Pacificimonas sp.]